MLFQNIYVKHLAAPLLLLLLSLCYIHQIHFTFSENKATIISYKKNKQKIPFIVALKIKKSATKGVIKNNKNNIFFFLNKTITNGTNSNNTYLCLKRNSTVCASKGSSKKKKYIFSLNSQKCSGYRNTREGKEETVRKIKRILKVTKLLIQLNSFKLTPNLRVDLLINMPRPHVRMHMVKNTLMKLAIKNTPFEAISPYLKESNVYLFIMNENYISFCLYKNKMFSSLYKEYKINNFIKVAIYENTILNKKETEDLINLKTYNYYLGHVVNKINNLITSIPNSIIQIPSAI
ncbi:50S ribosomal protein L10, putative, partial [Hepatocystis sp. ex Piliocolobus tephrosceles]